MTQPLIGGAGRIDIVSLPQQLLCSSAGTAFFIRASRLAGASLWARAGAFDLSNIFLATFNSIATPSMAEGR
jgi:hypothetical protein